MIRLFLAADHPVLREGRRALFAQDPSRHVVGEAESGAQLLARLPATPGDVVLLALHLPGLDGLAATRRRRAAFPAVRILILSMADHGRAIGGYCSGGTAVVRGQGPNTRPLRGQRSTRMISRGKIVGGEGQPPRGGRLAQRIH